MNRIKRIAAAAAISTAVLAPAIGAVAPAYAEPDSPTQAQIEALLRQEQRYMQESAPIEEQLLRQERQYVQDRQWPEPVDEASTSGSTTSFPWQTVGLAALGAGVLAAGAAVAVTRRSHREPRPA